MNWNKLALIGMLLAILIAAGGASLGVLAGLGTAGILFLVAAIVYYAT